MEVIACNPQNTHTHTRMLYSDPDTAGARNAAVKSQLMRHAMPHHATPRRRTQLVNRNVRAHPGPPCRHRCGPCARIAENKAFRPVVIAGQAG
jgi:hypothetical protein